MIKFIANFVFVFALASCVAPEDGKSGGIKLPTDAEVEQYNALVDAREKIICRQETKIGTNIPKRVCRRIVDIEETSAFHKDQLRRALR